MANKVSETIAKMKNNPVGLIVGAGAGFAVAKYAVKSEKTWVLVVSAIVGGVVGAMAQSAMKAKAGQPTASTVASTPKK